MQVSIRDPQGKIFTVEVNDNETVKDLKEKICEINQLPIINQILFFDKMKLEDNRTLAEYNIVENSLVYLFIRYFDP